MTAIMEHLVTWLHGEVTGNGGTGVVFGVSGGIDSAVVAGLAAQAFPRSSLCVLMPCHSDPQDAADGELVARHFGLEHATVDLSSLYDTFVLTLSAARLGYLNTSDRRWYIAAVDKRFLELITIFAAPQQQVVNGHTIDSRCALVGNHTEVSSIQIIPFDNLFHKMTGQGCYFWFRRGTITCLVLDSFGSAFAV